MATSPGCPTEIFTCNIILGQLEEIIIMLKRKIIIALFILVTVTNVYAIKVDGTFTAIKSCPAYKSFKKGHNPGDVHTVPGRSYEIVEENKAGGTWVLVLVPEISHTRRWVAKECGVVNIEKRYETSENEHSSNGSNKCNIKDTYDSNVLALSWQAGFCEHFSYSGLKPECDNLNSGQIVITNITIHGLWPNKKGCGRSYGNCSDVQLDLENETIAKIAPWMPNWFYSTAFGNHEWKKHGTCQGLQDDDYFLLIQRLAEKFDSSPLGDYLRENMGKEVQVAEMKKYLASNIGEDITKKIELRCTGSGKRYINEFWINLPKDINASGSFSDLVYGAQDKPNFQGNCAEKVYIEAPGSN